MEGRRAVRRKIGENFDFAGGFENFRENFAGGERRGVEGGRRGGRRLCVLAVWDWPWCVVGVSEMPRRNGGPVRVRLGLRGPFSLGHSFIPWANGFD